MRFDLIDLRLFLQVLDSGSITAGAAASHLTLASASARVRAMEHSLQAPLLLRGPRGVQPTAAGRTLLHHARLVVQQLDRLQGELAAHGSGAKGHVRLLCNTSAVSEHLPRLLQRFLAARPGVSVDLEERASAQVADALRSGIGDIGLAADSADLQGLQTFPFAADPLVLVLPRGHALATRRSLALADVVDQPFIGLPDNSALQQLVTRQARLLGRQLVHRVRLRSLEAVCRMVGEVRGGVTDAMRGESSGRLGGDAAPASIGIAVVPLAVARRCARSAGIRQVPLSDAWAARKLLLCVRQRDTLPAPAQQLLQHLLDAAQPTR